MSEAFDPRKSTTAFDQASTLVLVLELSGKSWRVGASVPGVSRRPMRNLAAGGVGAVLEAIERWKGEARKAGCEVGRVVAGYEAGLDGFWIARALMAMASKSMSCIPRAFRSSGAAGAPRRTASTSTFFCAPSSAGSGANPGTARWRQFRAKRRRTCANQGDSARPLTAARLKVENRMRSLLARFGIANFRPRLKKAAELLSRLRTSTAGRRRPTRWRASSVSWRAISCCPSN